MLLNLFLSQETLACEGKVRFYVVKQSLRIRMVFECSLQTFHLHSLHCCLTFWSLLCGQTMQRFFWGGPSSARTCFCVPVATERASNARTVGAFKPFGYCALFSLFCLINFSPSAQRMWNRAQEVKFIPGTTGGRSLYKTNDYMSINPGCHRTQQADILMFCNMLCSGRLFDPAHQHLLWSYYKIQWFLVCLYHLSCHHGA